MEKALRWRIILTMLCELPLIGTGVAWAAGPAGVKLDGTLGGTAQVLGGPTFNITQPLGRLAGSNLFFSFQYFNIAAGETALFSTTSAGINNVISRVTGGYASSINGTIQLNAASGAPNFFFINPSGVTFGPGAVVNVPAAFQVTTADYLKFTVGNFYVDPNKQSTLSAAAPQSFGFLGQSRSRVDIQGTTLSAGTGGHSMFQVVAGDVTIEGVGAGGGISNSTGDIRVIALGAEATEVPMSGTFSGPDGAVTIQNGGILTTAGGSATAGSIYVSAGTLTVDGTHATSQTGILSQAGLEGAAPIAVNAADAVLLTNGGGIRSSTTGPGAGANVGVNAGALAISGSDRTCITGVETDKSATGVNGSISVTVGTLALDGSGSVVGGPATGIGSYAGLGASGRSGQVIVNVTGTASISNGGSIYADTAGASNAGTVGVSAGSISINGGDGTTFTGISSDAAGTGSAGNVAISTKGAMTLLNNADISSDTYGAGNGGDVVVNAGSLTINGGTSSNYLTGILGLTGGTAQQGVTVNSTGSAGKINVVSTGAISLLNGGVIDSESYGLGNAGDVIVKAASLNLDGGTGGIPTFIASDANGVTGSGGNVKVSVKNALTMANGAYVSADTYGAGSGGDVTVSSGSLSINGGTTNTSNPNIDYTWISSDAYGTGSAGNVTISTKGAMTLLNYADISSDTYGAGNGGDVVVNAGSLTINGGTSNYLTGILSLTGGTAQQGVTVNSTGSAGKINVVSTGTISLLKGGVIDSESYGLGNAGNVIVKAASLNLDGGTGGIPTYIASDANGVTGSGGNVKVSVTNALTMANGAYVSADTYGAGSGGGVTVSSGSLSLVSAEISADTYAAGNAGDVLVKAASMTIDGGTSNNFTGISSETIGIANQGSVNSTGAAGKVVVTSSGAINILNGAGITSDSGGLGNAGDVTVTARSLRIDGGTQGQVTYISSDAEGATGDAGKVTVSTSGGMTLTNFGQISSDTYGSGNGGKVAVAVGGALTITNGSNILSDTFAGGRGGDVAVRAASVSLDGAGSSYFTGIASDAEGISDSESTNSTGSAGAVAVTVSGLISIVNGSDIASASYGTGNAGSVTATAASLSINGGNSNHLTGITTDASTPGSSSTGGVIHLTVGGSITLLSGGIDSNTESNGGAGSISITTPGTLSIGGSAGQASIASTASTGSGGQPGTIAISAGSVMIGANGGVSVENDATLPDPSIVAPTHITIHANTLLLNGGVITAASTGNVDASAIDLDYGQSLRTIDGSITTEASDGNGGPITISGSGVLRLDGSQITTSVSGASGNGGDIDISVPLIAMNTAAIQANTAARHASGGDINIDAQAIVPSFQFFILGGTQQNFKPTRDGQNLVQAAAADGVSGTLDVTTPTLDIGGALLALTGKPAAPTPLGRSLCGFTRGSSLSATGRGGLPASASDPLWIGVDDADRATARSSPRRSIDSDDLPVEVLVSDSTVPCQ
jgi:filamentous hemagglutinin family protein